MKASELRERNAADLLSLRDQLRRELFSSRMKNYTGRLNDTSLIRKNRRDIARIEGVLRAQRAQGGEVERAGALSVGSKP